LVVRGLRDISASSQEDNPGSTDDLALGLFQQNKFDEAIAICTSGLAANPKDECLWLIKGMCFSEQEKYDELLQCVLPLLEIDEQNTRHWWLVAQVLCRLQRFEDELEYLQRLVEIDSQYSGAWRAIGDCLFSLGRYQEAVQAFDSELKLNAFDDYSRSRREDTIAVWRRAREPEPTIESEDLIPSLIVTLDHWWVEPTPQSQLPGINPLTRSFSVVCKIESISDREQLLSKQMTVVRRFEDGKVYWVADALFVDSDATRKKIQPNSEWVPVTLEVTWLCTSNETTDDCVREFVSGAEKTFGRDDTFGTVLQFVWEGG